MDGWNLINFPSFLLEGIEGTVSGVGEVLSSGATIQYEWVRSFLLQTASLLMKCTIGEHDRAQHWSWLFTDNTKAGFLLIETDKYLLDDESQYWQVTYPMFPPEFSFTAVGDFSGMDYVPPALLLQMFAATWAEIPPDERLH